MKKTDRTIDYYDQNADRFAQQTGDLAFTEIQNEFLKLLPDTGSILDFGCGAGRDSAAFLAAGYRVKAVDGSARMVQIASEKTGLPVKQQRFEDLNEKKEYDGIWACASLLHISSDQLPSILVKAAEALKPNGILYCSFKYGDFEGWRNGRYFTDRTEESLRNTVKDIPSLEPVRMWISSDVRKERNSEQWLNALFRKI